MGTKRNPSRLWFPHLLYGYTIVVRDGFVACMTYKSSVVSSDLYATANSMEVQDQPKVMQG